MIERLDAGETLQLTIYGERSYIFDSHLYVYSVYVQCAWAKQGNDGSLIAKLPPPPPRQKREIQGCWFNLSC